MAQWLLTARTVRLPGVFERFPRCGYWDHLSAGLKVLDTNDEQVLSSSGLLLSASTGKLEGISLFGKDSAHLRPGATWTLQLSSLLQPSFFIQEKRAL